MSNLKNTSELPVIELVVSKSLSFSPAVNSPQVSITSWHIEGETTHTMFSEENKLKDVFAWLSLMYPNSKEPVLLNIVVNR